MLCRIAHLGCLFLLLGLPGGCSQSRNQVLDFDPDTDFSRFQSFAWTGDQEEAGTVSSEFKSLMDQRLRQVLEQKLEIRGLALRPADQADLLVRGRVVSRLETRVETLPGNHGSYRRWGGTFGPPVYESVVLEEEAVWLILDFHERATHRQVWMGARRLCDLRHLSPQARRRVSEEAVEELMASYPPPVSAAPGTTTPAASQ